MPAHGQAPDNEQMGWNGGFDVVLSNPPWERIKLQEKEWFASRRPDIATAANAAARRRMIDALANEDPALHGAFLDDRRAAEGESAMVRNSGFYPLCGRGDVNTYAVFAELARQVLSPAGRSGIIVPTGIATDDTTKFFFQDLIERKSLVSLYDFENEEFLFPGVHHGMKFCLLTLSGVEASVESADLFFFARQVDAIKDQERHIFLTERDIVLLNPNTRTCPIFRSQRDAELTKVIYRRVPVLIKDGPPEENPWRLKFSTMFHMSGDSHLFHTREQLETEGLGLVGNRFLGQHDVYVPLYEAKMLHTFDHRFGTFEGQTESQANQSKLPELDSEQHSNPMFLPRPRYWVSWHDVEKSLGSYNMGWLIAFRDVTNAKNERTAISCIIPRSGVGHNAPFVILDRPSDAVTPIIGNLSAFMFDYLARQSVAGMHLTYSYFKQLPVLPPATYTQPCRWSGHVSPLRVTHHAWLLPRVLELTYTAWDLQPFARDCGYDGPPFRWDEDRRFLLRCELDAAYFHLYGIARDDVDYIMETFPIVKRKDVAAHGEYRTKRVILEIYDAMQRAMDTGEPYQTRLDPPPADPRVAHEGPPPDWLDNTPSRATRIE